MGLFIPKDQARSKIMCDLYSNQFVSTKKMEKIVVLHIMLVMFFSYFVGVLGTETLEDHSQISIVKRSSLYVYTLYIIHIYVLQPRYVHTIPT